LNGTACSRSTTSAMMHGWIVI